MLTLVDAGGVEVAEFAVMWVDVATSVSYRRVGATLVPAGSNTAQRSAAVASRSAASAAVGAGGSVGASRARQ